MSDLTSRFANVCSQIKQVAIRGSGTQLQVGGNLNKMTSERRVEPKLVNNCDMTEVEI